MSLTVDDGSTVVKDPSASQVYTFDWDIENLSASVTITTSSFTIVPLYPSTTDAMLEKDSEAILAGNRKTRLRLMAGTVGQSYEITNRIVTNESPSQVKERSLRVLIENL